MYIKDNSTGVVRKYGTDPHDSLVITDDGRFMYYENLQNCEVSAFGTYVFCDEYGRTPGEIDDPYDFEYGRVVDIGGHDLSGESEEQV